MRRAKDCATDKDMKGIICRRAWLTSDGLSRAVLLN